MKVLLISPLPTIDPACGDIIYTETLLASPPANVEYETYAQAVARGSLLEHATGRALRRAVRERKGILREAFRVAIYKATNVARKWHWMFWEPSRCFSVRPGEYDLIHIHVFSAQFLNLPCPVVVSNAAPVRSLYRDARRYSQLRVWLMEAAERFFGWISGVNVVSYSVPQAARVIAFTDYLRNWYVSRGIAPASRVDVVPIYLANSQTDRRNAELDRIPLCVGFIAKDFEAKGGPVLLRAFELVRGTRPDAELVIVGCAPRITADDATSRGIRWIPYIPRDQLMSDVLPSFDVLGYPTEFDGMPLVVLEALSLGIPVATSDYQAMPELVDHGRAGLVSPVGDAEALAVNLLALLELDENRKARAAASRWFAEAFSAEAVRPRLLTSYERAIAESPLTVKATAYA